MRPFNTLTIIFVTVLFFSCGNKKHNFSITTNAKKGTIIANQVLELKLNNPDNVTLTSTKFLLGNEAISAKSSLKGYKLGKQTIKALVTHDSKTDTVTTQLTILNDKKPKVYGYELINTYPHDIAAYTQGLEFYNGMLYESTGQKGKSKLRKIDYKTGKILKNVDLAKNYFGEGLTIMKNKLYQLTWQSGTGFIYNAENLEKEGSFAYGKSQEGWGLCNDNVVLYKSDGTSKIWTLSHKDLTEKDYIQVFTNKGKIGQLNELEWVNGKIYANIYQRNGVAIINPSTGATEGVIDFSPLKKIVKQHDELDVLNGIAYNKHTQTLFVTGKHWDKLFEVKIIEK